MEEEALERVGGIKPQDLLLGKKRRAIPKHYVSKGCPPFLLIHGRDDDLVPASHSEGLYDELVILQIW